MYHINIFYIYIFIEREHRDFYPVKDYTKLIFNKSVISCAYIQLFQLFQFP